MRRKMTASGKRRSMNGILERRRKEKPPRSYYLPMEMVRNTTIALQ